MGEWHDAMQEVPDGVNEVLGIGKTGGYFICWGFETEEGKAPMGQSQNGRRRCFYWMELPERPINNPNR